MEIGQIRQIARSHLLLAIAAFDPRQKLEQFRLALEAHRKEIAVAQWRGLTIGDHTQPLRVRDERQTLPGWDGHPGLQPQMEICNAQGS